MKTKTIKLTNEELEHLVYMLSGEDDIKSVELYSKLLKRINENKRKQWYQNGKLHRLDGPAMECV